MSDQEMAAAELQELMQHPYFHRYESIRAEMAKDAEAELIGMFSIPEALTEGKAIRLAARREALIGLKDEVESRLKILIPKPERAGR